MRWLALAFSAGGIALALINPPDSRADASLIQAATDRPVDLELGEVDLDRAIRKVVQHTSVQVRLFLFSLMSQGSTLSDPAPRHLKSPTLRSALSELCRPPRGAHDPLVFEIEEDAIATNYHFPPFPREGTRHQPNWVVRGKVVDPQGKPIARATVRIFCWASVSFVATDEAGEFEGRVPLNGSLVVHAWDEKDERQAWQFVSGAGDGGGKDAELSLTLTAKPTRDVSVVVKNKQGELIEGARVVLLAGGFPYEFPQRTRKGDAAMKVPADADFDAVIAWKSGLGMNYIGARHEHPSARNSAPLPIASPIQMILGPARPATFRILDQSGKPQAGAPLAPHMMRHRNASVGLNLAILQGRANEISDSDGLLTFDWFPEWQSLRVGFNGNDRRFGHMKASFDPSTRDAGPIDVPVERLVELRGKVLDAAGKPANGVYVMARGIGFDRNAVNSYSKSQDDGTYVLRVSPYKSYFVVAVKSDSSHVSPPYDGILTYPDQPIENITLQLQPGIRVTGNVGAHRVMNGVTTACLWQVGEDLGQRRDTRFPDAAPIESLRPKEWIRLSPDEDGNIELLLGPGQYEYAPSPEAPRLSFELVEQKEFQLHFPPD